MSSPEDEPISQMAPSIAEQQNPVRSPAPAFALIPRLLLTPYPLLRPLPLAPAVAPGGVSVESRRLGEQSPSLIDDLAPEPIAHSQAGSLHPDFPGNGTEEGGGLFCCWRRWGVGGPKRQASRKVTLAPQNAPPHTLGSTTAISLFLFAGRRCL